MASGITWYPLDTDLLTNDEKVFDLMDGQTNDVAFASFGRFVALLAKIYHEGPALEVTPLRTRRLASDLGLSAEGFLKFVSRCVDAELFDRGLWEGSAVLTSHGIQSRWLKAKRSSRITKLPDDFQQWSLLDGRDGNACAPTQLHTVATQEHATATQEHAAPDKTRLDKNRLDKKREESSVSSSGEGEVFDNRAEASQPIVENPQPEPSLGEMPDTSDLVPPCMARERNDDTCFFDDAEAPHRTPYGALAARYESQTGRRDFGDFMAKVHSMCPGGCRASPRDVGECYALICGAIEHADPSKGSPWALTRHVLANDRGSRHA